MGTFRERVSNRGPRKGQPTLYYSWKGPERQKDGALIYRRFERSTGTCDRKIAEQKARAFELEAFEAANRVERPKEEVITFARAATLYIKSGGSTAYLEPILQRIGLKAVSEVTQEVAIDLCEELKSGCTPSTWNRHVFTPILAVCNHVHKLRLCPPVILQRPKGHDAPPPLEIPDEDWFEIVARHANDKTKACMLLLTLHGVRVSEAIERKPSDVDTTNWTLRIPTTKTGDPVQLRLSPPVIEAIKAIKDWRKQNWLFGSRHRSNLHKRIKEAVRRAEKELQERFPSASLKVYGSHAYGRHSFASRLLNGGFSLKFVQDAGRWKTIAMPAMRYGHLEQSEVEAAANKAGAEWARKVLSMTGNHLKDASGTK